MAVDIYGHSIHGLHSPCPVCGYATRYKQWPTRCACNRSCSKAELEKWVWHRSGRYEYTPYRRNSTNPDHLIPGRPPSGPPLRIADRYAAGPRPKRKTQ
jgi:hypothetical protein